MEALGKKQRRGRRLAKAPGGKRREIIPLTLDGEHQCVLVISNCYRSQSVWRFAIKRLAALQFA